MSGWKKRPAQTEISSTQWTLRTARKPRACESPITKGGYASAHEHEIAAGDHYAYNTYYQTTYCLDCFRKWAPTAVVRRLDETSPEA